MNGPYIETHEPQWGVRGDLNKRILIRGSDFREPVYVGFFEVADCDQKPSKDATHNADIRIVSAQTSGSRIIRVLIDISHTAKLTKNRIGVINGDGKKLLSPKCFEVLGAPLEGSETSADTDWEEKAELDREEAAEKSESS
jgi:hypothetical protein